MFISILLLIPIYNYFQLHPWNIKLNKACTFALRNSFLNLKALSLCLTRISFFSSGVRHLDLCIAPNTGHATPLLIFVGPSYRWIFVCQAFSSASPHTQLETGHGSFFNQWPLSAFPCCCNLDTICVLDLYVLISTCFAWKTLWS